MASVLPASWKILKAIFHPSLPAGQRKPQGIKKSATHSMPPKYNVKRGRAYPQGKLRKVSRVVAKSRPKASKVVDDGQGNQKLGSSYGHPAGKLHSKLEHMIRQSLNPVNNSVIQNVTRMTATRGTCSYTSFSLADVADIDACRANANSMMPGTQLAFARDGKFMLKDGSISLSMSNASSGLATIRIYEWVARKALPSSYTSVNDVVTNGFSDVYTTAMTATTYGGTLFNNPRFTAYFKVKKVRTIQLGCGRSFQLNLSIRNAKTINPVYDCPNYIATHGGYTRGFVLQVFGQPVSYTDAGDAVTSDDVKIEVIQQKRYHWQVVNYPMNGNFLTNTIPTAAGNLELIDAGGDRQTDVEA